MEESMGYERTSKDILPSRMPAAIVKPSVVADEPCLPDVSPLSAVEGSTTDAWRQARQMRDEWRQNRYARLKS
jgi:hypothetical protein